MSETLVVIGGTAAGLSAASKLRRLRPDWNIIVYERGGYVSYGACGLPYFISDMIARPEQLVTLSAEELRAKRGMEVHTHHEVRAIDREAKNVLVANLDTGATEQVHYDKLVLATGATPLRPAISGIDAQGVHVLRTVEDGVAIKEHVRAGVRQAAIIGGGFIGLELAGEFARMKIPVRLYEQADRLLPALEPHFSAAVLRVLEENGVAVQLNASVDALLETDGKVHALRLSSGEVEHCDLVLLSTGVRPATALAEQAGLTLGLKGGIVTDERMQTSDANIWACGDCALARHIVTGEPCYYPLGTTANKQGRVAGANIGGEASVFPGVLGSSVTKIFDLTIASSGLSLTQALAAGFNAHSSSIVKGDRASYYPGGGENQLALIFDGSSGRLLGAQGIGSESVAGRINVLATAITAGMTVAQISALDLVYAPPVAPVYDPILIAGSQANKQVGKSE